MKTPGARTVGQYNGNSSALAPAEERGGRSADGPAKLGAPAGALLLTGRRRHTMGVVCDVALALVVVVAASRYNAFADLGMGGLMALCLLARRRLPGTVLVVVLALVAAQFALHDLLDLASAPAAYDVAVLFAMMSVVHHARTVWMPYAAGVAVLSASATGLVGLPGTGIDPFLSSAEDVLFLWGLTIAVWLMAYSLHARRLYAESQVARAGQAEREREHLIRIAAAEERAEIARELHDVVAHSLAVMILQADGAGYALRTSPETAAAALDAIASTGRDAIEDMHRIVRVLRGGDQNSTSTGSGRRIITLDEIHTAVERARAAGLSVNLSVEVGEERLTAAEQMTAFRIVQECLTNVLRHAGPDAEVEIRLREDRDTLLITVVDDGSGRLAVGGGGAGGHSRSGGNGLVGMRERVELAGGSFTAGPRLGRGWQVCTRIPTRKSDDTDKRADPGGRR
ncbi:sensor histidine kinase [Streptomyces sp. NPDC008313]|uniref:sensor histidine kinase n=1 Tax=Streptomyces sp. NPDC008313 TaxID=3364826 RepID=UPI0036E3A140